MAARKKKTDPDLSGQVEDARRDWKSSRRRLARRRLSAEEKAELRADTLGGQLGPGDAEENIGLLADHFIDWGARARSDLSTFFELTFVHEQTGAELKTQPHQALLFDFVQAFRTCVVRTPIETFKSYSGCAIALDWLGKNPRWRGIAASRIVEMAADNIVRLPKQYLENPARACRIQLAYPELRQRSSEKEGVEKWTQKEITVERPSGIRHSSLTAIGKNAGRSGIRADFAVVDDLVSADDESSQANREATANFFYDYIHSRVDKKHGRIMVINTPWHREDLTFELEKERLWPTLKMNVYGEVVLTNVPPGWGSSHLVPSVRSEDAMMLRFLEGRGPDEISICPLRYPPEDLPAIRKGLRPLKWAQQYLCSPMSDEAARCERSWITACKRAGIGMHFVEKLHGSNPIYCGIDLAIGRKKHHDKTVFFVFELLPDYRRRVLWIESGRLTGPAIVEKIFELQERYAPIFVIESNAAQDFLRQFLKPAVSGRSGPPPKVVPFVTGSHNKFNADFGVESIFVEFKQEQWIFPSGIDGDSCPQELEDFLEEDCLLYNPADKHTPDKLMACWFARERARRGGGGRDPKPKAGGPLQMARTGGF